MQAKSVYLLIVALVAASCGSPVVTPSPATPAPTSPATTATPSAAPTSSTPTSPLPAPSTGPSGSPLPALTGSWNPAGTLALGRGVPHAVLLGDGKVLVLGNDGDSGRVTEDSVRSEIWTAATASWSSGPSLNKPRAQFVALPMADGRVLVTGGVNAGSDPAAEDQEHHLSYSGTYVFDPRRASAGWSAVAPLGHARTAPSAAVLPDGRVLVAGGYYLSGAMGLAGPSVAGDFAAYRPDVCGAVPCAPPLADVAPPTAVPALATTELYDPVADAWSATGPLRYARVGAPAVTLADGRVLVVSSTPTHFYSWNYRVPKVSDRAYDTAEVFDPGAGRFSLTGDLPAVDWSPLAKLGPYPITSDGVTSVGTLVALADGGALLVGNVTSWSIRALALSGSTTRTLRFDPGTGRWTEIDQTVYTSGVADEPIPAETIVQGHSRRGAIAVRLADGRVLIAGGYDDLDALTKAADLYDPATGTWTALAPMPEANGDGAAVLLADSSVLVVGGHGETGAVRFIPAR